MHGMCLSDFIKSGGYNEKWAYHWGAEDVDIFSRVSENLLVIRPEEDELIYAKGKINHTGIYYEKLNLYDQDPPISPLSKLITEKELQKRLQSMFLRSGRGFTGKTYRTYARDAKLAYYTGWIKVRRMLIQWKITSSLAPVIDRLFD